MKRLDSLIRVRQWQLDESRRHVAELEDAIERTRQRIRNLDTEIANEGRVADQAGPGSGFASYAAGVRDRRAKLAATVDTLGAELAQAQEQVAEAFQELKKFELVQEARRQRERDVSARREQFALDEMASARHRPAV